MSDPMISLPWKLSKGHLNATDAATSNLYELHKRWADAYMSAIYSQWLRHEGSCCCMSYLSQRDVFSTGCKS